MKKKKGKAISNSKFFKTKKFTILFNFSLKKAYVIVFKKDKNIFFGEYKKSTKFKLNIFTIKNSKLLNIDWNDLYYLEEKQSHLPLLKRTGMWLVDNWLSHLTPIRSGEPRRVQANSPGKWVLLNKNEKAPSNWAQVSSTKSWNESLSPAALCLSYKYLINLTTTSVSVSDSKVNPFFSYKNFKMAKFN